MTIQDFRDDFLTTIKVTAETEQDSTVACFVKEAADLLLEGNIIPDYECAFFTGTGKRNKRLRVDGYALDDFDMTMYLLIADYDGGETPNTLTQTQSKIILDRMQAFLEEVLSGNLLDEMEISRPSYDMAENILRNYQKIRKYSFILLTDRLASERLDNLSSGMVQDTIVEYHVWDINRLFLLSQSDNESEVCINLSDYMQEPLACLEASSTSTDEYKSYLCVLPASTLADIYDHYGSRLLEGNVRSFLSTKRAVNKKIRETILREPLRFFAYNNGISATATEVVKSRNGNGVFISEIKGLQIVNGGQTTASLSNARYRDNATLDNIFVQMKLTEVAPQIATEIIPQISRSSNSQNKVSEADFFSNHPFHIRIEQLSRRILAPSVDGAQYDTHWFYERANGQFLQAQSRMTKAEKKRFLMVNPQKQKVTKTDLAKAINSWRLRPHKVSLGAQKNFADFAQWVTAQWEENSLQFNELFFKKSMALIIMFRFSSSAIKKQPYNVPIN